MKIKNYSINFSNMNNVGTVSDCTIKRKKTLTYIGKYDLKFLFEALNRLDNKPFTRYVRLYSLPHVYDKKIKLLIIEDFNKKNHGSVVAPCAESKDI